MADRPRGRPLGWTRLAFRLAASRLGLLAASMLTALVAATLLVTASVLTPALAGHDRDGDDQDRLAFGAAQDIDGHAEVTQGRWPDPGATPIEAVIHADALARLGLSVGDRLTVDLFAGALDTVDALIV